MKHEVYWKNPGYKIRPKLQKDIECDYLIVGGGITGVSLAYFLNKVGAQRVVLIERNIVANGATGKAAGTLVIRGELDLQHLIKKFGSEKGRDFWNANHEGLQTVKDIIKKEKIKCDYDPEDTIYGSLETDPYWVFDEYILEKNIEESTELVVGKQLKKKINTPIYKYAILSKNHGVNVNPLAFTQNLSKVIEKKGVKVYENTPLLHFHAKKHIADTPMAQIKFKKIFFCVDAEIRHSGVKKIKSTIIVTEPLTKAELRNINLLPKKIIWDSKKIYHYMKITGDNRILIGYGDKHVHKKHSKIDPHHPQLKKIISYLHKLFPHLHKKIEYAWSGSFGISATQIPVIEQKGSKITIAGAASQVVCVMATKHVALKLFNKPSSLDKFFGKIM